MALLEVTEVKRHFGAVRAVDGVTMAVPDGEIRAVIGPNGAGKTTLFNVIAGRLAPTSGDVAFEGESIIGVAPHRIVHRGIGVTFQISQLFEGLTVQESVEVGVLSARGMSRSLTKLTYRLRDVQEQAREKLRLVGLEHLAAEDSGTLSHGDRKALEIGIALAGEPKMLLLDEPTAGMSAHERHAVVDLLGRLRDDLGLTILFTEHDVDMVLAFSDRITCMVRGQVVADGGPEEVRQDEAVRAAYLGRRVEGDGDAA
jgi:branched-chain amino acid transport system ATP-binding protein